MRKTRVNDIVRLNAILMHNTEAVVFLKVCPFIRRLKLETCSHHIRNLSQVWEKLGRDKGDFIWRFREHPVKGGKYTRESTQFDKGRGWWGPLNHFFFLFVCLFVFDL